MPDALSRAQAACASAACFAPVPGDRSAAASRIAGNTTLKLLPRPGSLLDFEFRRMAVDHMLDDGQPEAGASGLPRTAAVDAVEAFGQARHVLEAQRR